MKKMNFGPVDAKEAEIYAIEELRAHVQYEILKLLKRSDLTQAGLAEKLDCSPSWVSQLLSDDANLTLESAAKVFFALGFRLDANPVPLDVKVQELCRREPSRRWRQDEDEDGEPLGHTATSKLLLAICRDVHQRSRHGFAINDNGYASDSREFA